MSAEWQSFPEYFPLFVEFNRLQLPIKPQHLEICDTLQRAVMGELYMPPAYADPEFIGPLYQRHVEFLIVNQPPRTGKTKINEALATWVYRYFSDAQIIFTSYSQVMADLSLSYVKRTMREPWYVELFGDRVHGGKSDHLTIISPEDGAWGNLYSAGTGGSLTGKGAGLKRPAGGYIGVDDPAKPDEIFSAVETENLKRWFENTLKSRRNSDRYCPVIVFAQRIGPEDLPGYLLSEYPESTMIIKFPGYVNGVSQFPETYSTDNLEAEANSPDRRRRFVYASQIQQEPVAFGGNLIATDSFRRYDINQPIKWERRLITCDTALKTEQHNDHSVLQLWGLLDRRAYLIDSMRGKWESPQLQANCEQFWKKHTADAGGSSVLFTIEEKAAGTPTLQALRKKGIPVKGIERAKDKVTRCHEITPFIDTGMVYIPRDGDAPWVGPFITECAQFKEDGTSKVDDQCDCLFDGVNLLLGKPPSILDVLGKKPAA